MCLFVCFLGLCLASVNVCNYACQTALGKKGDMGLIEPQKGILNFLYLLLAFCSLLLMFCSTFSAVLFNSSVSTSKTVNGTAFVFFTFFSFTAAMRTHPSLVYHTAGRADCGPCRVYISAPGLRMKAKCKPTPPTLSQDQLPKTVHERSSN